MTAIRALALLGALAAAVSASAVVTGSIFGPGTQTIAVAVVPPEPPGGGAPGALGAEFARVLSRDLDLSGYFRLVSPSTFVQGPGVAAEAIDWVGWAAIGVQELVKGTIDESAGTVGVEIRLFDVAERREVPDGGRRLLGPRADLPRLAHRPEHLHYHADEGWIREGRGRSAFYLALIVGADPCVLILPIMLATAEHGAASVALVTLAYSLTTVGLMVGLSVVGVAGSRRIPVPAAARHMETASGLLIALVGVVFLLIERWR